MKTIGLIVFFLTLAFSAAVAAKAGGITIAISPSVLNLDSQGTWVTVHAEIPYSTVVGASVTLDGLPVESTFADDRGELVAKFALAQVKDSLKSKVGSSVTLTLSGTTEDGGTFSGTDTVAVIQSRKP
jgi:hypothetical protein